jgi:hypothetical protein
MAQSISIDPLSINSLFLASEPDLDIHGDPYFFIDATTRGGMSGSPVLLRLFGGYNAKNGNYNMTPGPTNLFMGIYSGRLNENSEIGRVWKPKVIHEILGATNPTSTSTQTVAQDAPAG